MWINDFEALNSGDQERFKKLVNYLLNKTYVISDIYEPRDKIGKINGDYRFIERNFDIFKGFLDMAGYTLIRDDERGVIYLESDYSYNINKLDKFSTLFLLSLRAIYDEEREKNSNKNVVFVRVNDVIYRMLEDKLLLKKPTVKDTVDALRTFIKFNILSRIEGNIEDTGCLMCIYPSITKVVSNEKIAAIYKIMFNEEDENTSTFDFEGGN